MPVIDYQTTSGKLRMRLGDIGDLPFLSDAIYQEVYDECDGNLNKAVIVCGQMILAQLAFKTHRRMVQLEVYGNEAFEQYERFLVRTLKDPAFMDVSFLPYATTDTEDNPIITFQRNWNKGFPSGTETQQQNYDSDYSPNDGSSYGPIYD